MALIEGLVDDLAEHCLVRVPRADHANLRLVSRAWRDLVSSAHFYEKRRQEGLLEEWLYVLSSEDVSRDEAATVASAPLAESPAVVSDSEEWEDALEEQEEEDMEMEMEDTVEARPAVAVPPVVVREVSNNVGKGRREDWRVICRAFDAKLGAWSDVVLPEEVSKFAHGSRIAVMGELPKLFVYGGVTISDNAETTAAVWSYDPKTQTWARAADMTIPRAIFAGGAIRGPRGEWRLYAAGGGNRAQQPPELSTAEVYIPEEDRWQAVTAMPSAKGMLEGLVFGGRLYLRDDGISDEAQRRALMEAYDPVVGAWILPANDGSNVGCPGNRGPCAGPMTVHNNRLYRVDPWDEHRLKIFEPSKKKGEVGSWVLAHGGLSVKDVLPPPFRPSEHGYQLVALRGKLAIITNSLVVVEIDLDLTPVTVQDPVTNAVVRAHGPSPPPFRVLSCGLKIAKARAADLGALQVMGL